MRLFIAIPVPDSVKQQLKDLEQPIEGVRWQKGNNFHLTLKFLGETSQATSQQLVEKLETIDLESFSIGLNGFGYFPQGRNPRVLWVGLKQNDQLLKLYQQVENICTDMGFKKEKHDFRPHITLARMDGAPKRDIMSFVNQHKQFRIPEVLVTEFVLYESKLHSSGAMHTRLKTFGLKQA